MIFRVGQVKTFSYGIVIAAAALLALLLMVIRNRKAGLKTGTVLLFSAIALPLCFLLSHTTFWLCSMDKLKKMNITFWEFRRGGYMLYGALAGGFAAAFIAAKLKKEPFGKILDAAAAPAALIIAAARFAEYLVRAGYGCNIEMWFDPYEEWSMIAWEEPYAICCFPFATQNDYGSWCFAINLLEGLAAVIFLIVLLRLSKRRSGGAISLLMLMYGTSQIIFESMRQDDVLRWGFVRVNQLISAVVVLCVLLLCWLKLPKEQRRMKELWLRVAMMLLSAGIVMLMEFALDQKINFLLWMRADVSYLVMAASCIWMLLNILPLWRRAWPKQQAART